MARTIFKAKTSKLNRAAPSAASSGVSAYYPRRREMSAFSTDKITFYAGISRG